MVKCLRKEPKPRHLRVKLGLLDTSRSTWSFGFNPGNPKQDSNSSMVGLYAMVHQVACQLHALTKILEETLYSHHMKLLHVAPETSLLAAASLSNILRLAEWAGNEGILYMVVSLNKGTPI